MPPRHHPPNRRRENDPVNAARIVRRAITARCDARTLRGIIEDCAQGSDARRAALLNTKTDGETPLEAALRLKRGDLVAVLLLAGAQVASLASPIALLILDGEAESLRALLLKTGWDVDAPLASRVQNDVDVERRLELRATHHCLLAPRHSADDPTPPPPRLDALEMLVREFGADVNGPSGGKTPLHLLAHVRRAEHQERALDALLALGADLEAADDTGNTPLWDAANAGDMSLVMLLLSRGASADVVGYAGSTPLMVACTRAAGDCRAISALLAASSPETRRAAYRPPTAGPDALGCSAADFFLMDMSGRGVLEAEPLSELMRGGVPLRPAAAAHVLPMAARLGERREKQLKKCVPELTTSWRAHEAYVKLAFDSLELREAEEGVRRREARVAELEAELRALGVGTEDADEEGDETDGTPGVQ
jgi:ankyrin repeat protein